MSAQTPGGTPTDPPSAAPAEPAAPSVETEAAATPSTADAPVEAAPAADVAAGDLPAEHAPAAQASESPAAAAEAPSAAPGELSPAACGARLAELFPALFVAPGGPGPFKPIKLRIQADIQARAPGVFSKRTLGIFFSRYTTTGAYLKALVAEGAQRFDLDGQPAGEIAEEHRAAAVEELARRHAIAAERRAAQRRGPPRRDGGAPAAAGAAIDGPAPLAGEAAGAAAPARPPRPDRPPRPPRTDARQDPRPEGSRPEGSRQGPQDRPRRDARDGPRRGPPPERGFGPRPGDRPAQGDAGPRRGGPRDDFRAGGGAPQRAPRAPEPALALPADPAQRERALLLRAFESSPLSKANFCALKRMTEAELDHQLAQARAERGR